MRSFTVFCALLITGLPSPLLPAAEERRVGELVINVRQDGMLVWNSKVLTEAQLTSQLQETARVDRKRAIIIRSDSRTKYEKIVRVLNMAHAAGLHNVSFAASTPRE